MIRLIHGEALEEMDKLIQEGLQVDAIITDPPQGKTACKWDVIIPIKPMWQRIKALRKDRTPIVLFGNEPFSSMLRMSNLKEWKYDWVWEKEQGTGFQLIKYRPLIKTENISVFCYKTPMYFPQKSNLNYYKEIKRKKGSNGNSKSSPLAYSNERISVYKGKYPINILFYKRDKNKLHSTQKPVALMEYLVKTYTKEGDIVLDFCMGSGSTGEACKNLNRGFIGIEKEKKDFDISRERLL